jgi:hypothetical protein
MDNNDITSKPAPATVPDKHPGGAPTAYDPGMITIINNAEFPGGATMSDFGKLLNVDVRSIYRWSEAHPEFCQAIAQARDRADHIIEGSLFARAQGYEHPEDKIFLGKDGSPVIVPTIKHYPPDTAAAQFWLTNRQRGKWAVRQEVEQHVTHSLEGLSEADIDAELAAIRARLDNIIDITPEPQSISLLSSNTGVKQDDTNTIDNDK